jgi:hypothetical protein
VNFFHDAGIETSTIVLSAFATAVEHGMRTCMERRLQEALSNPATEVMKMPPIVKRYYAGVVAGAVNSSAS